MNNAAAIGYMILAAKQAEMPVEHIQCLEELMREQMEINDEGEAEDAYNQF